MGEINGGPQEGMTVEQAAKIIQQLYDQSAPEINDDELRIDAAGRDALRIAHVFIMKGVQQPAFKSTIFRGQQAAKLKAKGIANFETLRCPCCEWIVADRSITGRTVKRFCENCGQAIKPE